MDVPNPVHYREKLPVESVELKNEVKIESLVDLNQADHIILNFKENEKLFCHAILKNFEIETNQIEIIYYTDGTENFSFLDDFQSDNVNDSMKRGVIQSRIQLTDKIEIYRVDYSQDCLSPSETIDKAEKFVGQINYNIFTNTDEHFCIYCKTGKAAKLFILSPNLNTKNAAEFIRNKFVADLANLGGQIMLVNTAKHIATQFPRSAVTTALPAVTQAACGALGI